MFIEESVKQQRRKERQALYNTKRWRETRDYMRMEYPLCQDCLKEGRITPMEEVHHIRSPFVRGLSPEEKEKRSFDIENLVCLCVDCHMRRHNPSGTVKDLLEKYK